MKYRSFPVNSSVLSSAALVGRVLSRYRIGRPTVCNFFNNGVNDTYVVRAGRSRYFLRIYRHGWRTKAEIEAEVDLLNYLARHRHPISRPVRRGDGAFLTRIAAPEGPRYAVLLSDAPGKTPDFKRAGKSRQYGEIAAGLHVAADRRGIDPRRFHLDLSHLIDKPLHHLESLLAYRSHDFDYLQRVGGELKSAVESLLPRTAPQYGFCHGDHHGGNVHQDDRDRMVVFDFDCWGYGWRAYDIAVFLWSHALGVGWNRAAKARTARRWNAFLEGYEKVRSLTEDERVATKLFVPIRHIWLLWLQTQGADNWGGGFINDGYFDHGIGFIRQSIKHYKLL